MAQRRMFSKVITSSSDFLMMSQSAQNLYFHIGMNSDDDGFCEIFSIMRMTESKPDDLRALHERGLIYVVDSKVCIVKDWHENNYIQSDRYTQSKYLKDPKFIELYKIVMEEKISKIERYKSVCIQDVSKEYPQVRLGKGRLGKGSSIKSDKSDDSFEKFWKSYPKKEAKKKAQSIWETKKLQNCLDTILDFIEKAKHTERWRTSQFIPLPTTFLNQERWTDELASYGIAERRVSVK